MRRCISVWSAPWGLQDPSHVGTREDEPESRLLREERQTSASNSADPWNQAMQLPIVASECPTNTARKCKYPQPTNTARQSSTNAVREYKQTILLTRSRHSLHRLTHTCGISILRIVVWNDDHSNEILWILICFILKRLWHKSTLIRIRASKRTLQASTREITLLNFKA